MYVDLFRTIESKRKKKKKKKKKQERELQMMNLHTAMEPFYAPWRQREV